VIGILVNDEVKVGDRSFLVVRELLQSFAHSEVGVQRLGVYAQRMFEVLGCSLAFSDVGEQVGEMDAGSEVPVVQSETLLVVKHTLLILLNLLKAAAQLKESVGLWKSIPLCLHLDGLLYYLNGFLELSALLEYLS
jgi:hypothetical protein